MKFVDSTKFVVMMECDEVMKFDEARGEVRYDGVRCGGVRRSDGLSA